MLCHLQAIEYTVLSAKGTDTFHPFIWIALIYPSGISRDVISSGKPLLISPLFHGLLYFPSDGINLIIYFSYWAASSLKAVPGTQ